MATNPNPVPITAQLVGGFVTQAAVGEIRLCDYYGTGTYVGYFNARSNNMTAAGHWTVVGGNLVSLSRSVDSGGNVTCVATTTSTLMLVGQSNVSVDVVTTVTLPVAGVQTISMSIVSNGSDLLFEFPATPILLGGFYSTP
jgi:hypothetical protein